MTEYQKARREHKEKVNWAKECLATYKKTNDNVYRKLFEVYMFEAKMYVTYNNIKPLKLYTEIEQEVIGFDNCF